MVWLGDPVLALLVLLPPLARSFGIISSSMTCSSFEMHSLFMLVRRSWASVRRDSCMLLGSRTVMTRVGSLSASAEGPGAVHHRTDEPCPVCGESDDPGWVPGFGVADIKAAKNRPTGAGAALLPGRGQPAVGGDEEIAIRAWEPRDRVAVEEAATVMPTPEDRIALARRVLSFAAALSRSDDGTAP